MDNLIADGKVVPAVIVMPFGHEISGATGKLPEVRAVQEMLGVTPVQGVPGSAAAARRPQRARPLRHRAGPQMLPEQSDRVAVVEVLGAQVTWNVIFYKMSSRSWKRNIA